MEEHSITVAILREIRDEIRATRADLSERIDQTNARLDTVVHEQIRQSTTMLDMQRVQEKLVDAAVGLDRRQATLERTVGQVVTELQKVNARLDNVLTGPLGRYVRAHDARIEALEHRVEAIEQKVG